jgi:hypothetical protein
MQGFLQNLVNKKNQSVGVLHVKPGEVEFLFFQDSKGTRKVLSYGVEQGAEWNTAKLLDTAVTQAKKHGNIAELIVTFPVDHFRAYITEEKIAPMPSRHMIGVKEARELEKQMETAIQRTFRRLLFRETGILPDDFNLQRVASLARSIDGYRVSHLDGYKRGEIEFSVLGLFLLEPLLTLVKKVAKKHDISKIQVVHIVEAIAKFAEAKGKEGVYLFVEEENTQIAIWKEGELSFPGIVKMGSRQFLDVLADEFGMQKNMAEELEKKHGAGTLSEETKERLQAALLPELKKFGTLVKSRFTQAKLPLPESLFIFGKGNALRDIQTIFGENIEEEIPFQGKLSLVSLLPKDVWEDVEFSGKGDSLYTALCLLGSIPFTKTQ